VLRDTNRFGRELREWRKSPCSVFARFAMKTVDSGCRTWTTRKVRLDRSPRTLSSFVEPRWITRRATDSSCEESKAGTDDRGRNCKIRYSSGCGTRSCVAVANAAISVIGTHGTRENSSWKKRLCQRKHEMIPYNKRSLDPDLAESE